MHGNGRIIFKDGSSYKGMFNNGNYHGKGIFTRADGEELSGNFKDGQFID